MANFSLTNNLAGLGAQPRGCGCVAWEEVSLMQKKQLWAKDGALSPAVVPTAEWYREMSLLWVENPSVGQ